MEFSEFLEQEHLWGAAVEHVRSTGKTGISNLQRHLRIGYNRAAWLLEWMEKRGLVGPLMADGTRRIFPQ